MVGRSAAVNQRGGLQRVSENRRSLSLERRPAAHSAPVAAGARELETCDIARTIPLSEEVHESLSRLKAERDRWWPESPWVFSRAGKPIKDFRKAWEDACTRAGVGDALLHDMRRSGVRNLVRAGVSEKTAMKISGHRTRNVFDRYDITSEKDLGEAMKKVQTHLNRKKK